MICGDRLRQAREFRGLTQQDLAGLAGVSQSAIASVEAGVLAVSDERLLGIARGVDFPLSYFRQPPQDDFPLGSLIFRARTSLTARQKDKAFRWAQVAYELARSLESRVHPLAVGLPEDLDDPIEAADLTRANLGLSPDRPVVNLINVLERNGVLVLSLPIDFEGLDAFSTWVKAETPRPVIAVVRQRPGDRMLFSIAHELAHLTLHQRARGSLKAMESEAHAFAAQFLMPRAAMTQEIVSPVTLTGLAALKTRWRVSIAALAKRARELEIISDRQYRYLCQQLGMRKWRRDEPEGVAVELEKPRSLSQLAEMLYGNPPDTKRIALDAHLPVRVVEDVLAGYAGVPTRLDPAAHPQTKVVPLRRRGTVGP